MLLRRIQENLDSERNESVAKKRFYWAKTKIALHVRFETPCIFQPPSEKQQREIIELYHVWDQKLSQQLIYFCKANSTLH